MKNHNLKFGIAHGEAMGAIFSIDQKYRYALWRLWDAKNNTIAAFIALNPSTATAVSNDPTVRRCINFAKDWGAGGMYMLNAFSYRATDPDDMKNELNPIGRDNDRHIIQFAEQADMAIICWGNHGKHKSRDAEILHLLKDNNIRPWCLGWNKGMTPKHPLYLSSDTVPRPYYSFGEFSDHEYIQKRWEEIREDHFS